MFVDVLNSSLMLLLLLCVFVKCNNDLDCPGIGGPFTAWEISRGGFDSATEITLLVKNYLGRLPRIDSQTLFDDSIFD